MAQKIVVDASVLVKWVKTRNEGLVKEARRLLTVIERRPLDVHVPALLHVRDRQHFALKDRPGHGGLERCHFRH